MSVLAKKDDTEILIKTTAKRLFFGEGKFNATTQEIADAAGVNRTLINYYFRSRDNLFKIVFDEAQFEEKFKSRSIMDCSEIDLKTKISHFIDDHLRIAVLYPYLEIYIVTRMNQGSEYAKSRSFEEVRDQLENDMKKEIEKGNLDPISVTHFVLNLVSLVSFPTCMRPLLQKNLDLTSEEFENILKERKEIIIKTIFKN